MRQEIISRRLKVWRREDLEPRWKAARHRGGPRVPQDKREESRLAEVWGVWGSVAGG